MIVRRRASVPNMLCAGKDTVAVRMPRHPLALRLIAEMGGMLAVTSANMSGHRAAKTADEALADLDGRVAVVLNGGQCPGGVASSIVDLVVDPPVLLREGALSAQQRSTLEQWCSRSEVTRVSVRKLEAGLPGSAPWTFPDDER